MTSAEFASFPVDQITVDRPVRQRRKLTDIDDLAGSIQRVGLINPIVIRKTGELIAGERRLEAITSLGWTHIPVQFVEDLSPDELHLVELEENIRRQQLEWQDECKAIEAYHRLKKQQNQFWSQEDTARALGKTQAEISQRLGVATAIAAGDERVLKADKYSVARGIVVRDNDRRANAELEFLFGPQEAVLRVPEVPIINADFTDWARTYSGPRFNFLHCDFPYGINAGSHNQGAGRALGAYEDTEDTHCRLIEAFGAAMSNVVAEQAHLMFWFPIERYQATFEALTAMGWRVDPVPLIWHKSDNTGILPDPNRSARRIYEAAFMASRGDRKIVQAVGNVIDAPVSKSIHMSEKPKLLLRHFFRMFVDDTTRMLDPTCGSGNAVAVAEEMGARSVLGLEVDLEFCERARTEFLRDRQSVLV